MLFLLGLILEILEVGLIEVEVGGLVFQRHSLVHGEDRSPFKQTLLHLSILLGLVKARTWYVEREEEFVYLFIYLWKMSLNKAWDPTLAKSS